MSDSGKLSADERAAVKQRAAELKAEQKRATAAEKAAGALQDVLAAIAEIPEPERSIAQGIHDIVTATAPHLAPRTYYGMPAYAKDGKVLCFYQPGAKFKTRYGTLGFEHPANLDDGDMWATHFAVIELTPEVRERITTLVQRAAGTE